MITFAPLLSASFIMMVSSELKFLMLFIHLFRFYLEHGYQNYCWLIITLVSYQEFVTFIRVLKIFPQSEFSTKFLCVLDNIYVFF